MTNEIETGPSPVATAPEQLLPGLNSEETKIYLACTTVLDGIRAAQRQAIDILEPILDPLVDKLAAERFRIAVEEMDKKKSIQ